MLSHYQPFILDLPIVFSILKFSIIQVLNIENDLSIFNYYVMQKNKNKKKTKVVLNLQFFLFEVSIYFVCIDILILVPKFVVWNHASTFD